MPGKTITIRLKDGEDNMKKMITDLRKTNCKDNRYFNRSESEIAKMLLEQSLKTEHSRLRQEVA
jgi:hypothetical protein